MAANGNHAETLDTTKSTADQDQSMGGRKDSGHLPVIRKSLPKERSPVRALQHSPSSDAVKPKARGKTPKRSNITPKISSAKPYVNHSVDRGMKLGSGTVQRIAELTSPRFEPTQKSSITNIKANDMQNIRLANISTLKNVQSRGRQPNYTLSDEERAIYGDRTASGCVKLDLLGKGGCALVWLG